MNVCVRAYAYACAWKRGCRVLYTLCVCVCVSVSWIYVWMHIRILTDLRFVNMWCERTVPCVHMNMCVHVWMCICAVYTCTNACGGHAYVCACNVHTRVGVHVWICMLHIERLSHDHFLAWTRVLRLNHPPPPPAGHHGYTHQPAHPDSLQSPQAALTQMLRTPRARHSPVWPNFLPSHTFPLHIWNLPFYFKCVSLY